MRLTPEQADVANAFTAHDHLRVVAFAGAGKTSTLVAAAKAAPHKNITYIAFNRAIAAEAQTKFPSNVTARTAHSLAFRAVLNMGYAKDRLSSPVNSRTVLDIPPALRSHKELIFGAIRRYCSSAADALTVRHVPRPRRPLPVAEWEQLREDVASYAAHLWARMEDPRDTAPIGHDGYVKIWQLSAPRLFSPVLFVDEAQDLNPVLIDIVRRHTQHGQVVAVGDPHQQIYAWRGAEDALEQLPGQVLRLTQSFRFGQYIAEFGGHLLSAMGETVPLRGNGRTDDKVFYSSSGVSAAILCRSNATVFGELASLVAEGGARVYVPGGVAELRALVDDAERLKAGHVAQTADLLGFTDWQQVREAAEEEGGGDLRKLVTLVDRHGCARLRKVFDGVLSQECLGSIAVSTCHKAKGLEWHSVQVVDDFALDDPSIEERRLFYVACTRAQQMLTVTRELADAFKSVGGAEREEDL